ncbi:hypothetical protein N7471_007483 [Penicillium samsonianum]|uniref:uncharacterized protein n=1 Tax=Penicillium samsonianum TaxID=1882272 RepID=UPI0025499423|nr:uncharacterized protein N7471_007483 [Penicillium samsonianum]KAJ6132268.1 hypothetical protein N7471_007483 [Penicillium samsonianum]
MSSYTMSNAMSNNFSITETDSEGQNSTPLLRVWHLTRPNDSSYADALSNPLMYRAQSTLSPFPDAISVLTATPDYLSTGAPRLVPQWWRCCGCANLVNPSLAPEKKCPICSHSECGSCSTETVP